MNRKKEEKQEKILDYIVQYITIHGYCPSFSEIGEGVGIKSKCTTHDYIKEMIENGILETDFVGAPRALRVPGFKFVKCNE